jgi:hypothetical protein
LGNISKRVDEVSEIMVNLIDQARARLYIGLEVAQVRLGSGTEATAVHPPTMARRRPERKLMRCRQPSGSAWAASRLSLLESGDPWIDQSEAGFRIEPAVQMSRRLGNDDLERRTNGCPNQMPPMGCAV